MGLAALVAFGCASNTGRAALKLDAGVTPDAVTPIDTRADSGPLACEGDRLRCGDLCVDPQVNPSHCGGCDRSCSLSRAEAQCIEGTCAVATCSEGYLDCDGQAINGCERDIASCEAGACETACGTTGTRSCDDPCSPSCVPPAEICNAMDDDCDGTCDVGATSCRRPIYRGAGNGHVFSAALPVVTTPPFTMEGAGGVFFVYPSEVAGLEPFFRCQKTDGRYFLTRSAGCEGAGVQVEQLGFVASTPQCGATPLYRAYFPGDPLNPATGANHFYTTSAAERDAALGGGYLDESIAAYVWLSN